MNYNATGLKGLRAFDSAGTPVTPDNKGTVTLGVGTYYFPFGNELGGVPLETGDVSVSALFAPPLAGTLSIEVTNFDATLSGSGQGAGDVSDFNANGSWQQYNPVASGSTYAAASGAGNSFTGLVLTMGGTNIGGAIVNLPGFGFRRVRAKIVTTAGGTIRIQPWGKLGA